ncbi:MAG TPA: polyribonucleotide nucleotidyltransferase, partial [Candidatus Pacearchaeota archaeon]|nr:polyribonucleotide nucleotidyltransferase [Candidatus Pacearchaeota archaeon]
IEDSTFEMILEKVLHQVVLKEGLRPDGRKIDEIRPITCQVGLFSQTHGSGLFCRGLTHVLSILTLAGPGQELLLEGMETVGTKRFLHHYNFPPYSSGEIKKIGSPGRREIGHGALAEKALRPLIPPKEEFPYTIRLVSEVLSSNGSTSMASVCASSLALFDGGVPIKRHIAGISCGLMMEENELKPISERDFKVLTDIQGPEDALGDMDLKIAGTSEGITAIQLDIKVKGLTLEILKEGFEKAKKARLEILEKMNQALPNPRPQLSPLAPQILTIKINPEKIGEVIGTGGKMINEITEKTDASIDIEEDGTIFVTAKSKENAQKAIDWINSITREIQVGEVLQGKVKKIVDFGLFIELLPGREGLLHTSEIPGRQTKRILLQTFKIGQILPVKVKNIDETGRINLALLSETSSKKEANPQVKYGAFKKRFRR